MTDHFCPIDHIAIDVVDFDTALAFFQDVFGMTVTRFQGPEEAPTSLWLDGGVQLCRVSSGGGHRPGGSHCLQNR